MAPEMELIGAQHVFQACGVRGEMEKGGCPIDEEQQLKEALNQCEPVERRWEPGDGKRLGRVTEACPEADTLSTVSEPVQTTTCGCGRKLSVPVSSYGTGSGSNIKLRKCSSWQVLVPVTVPVLIIITTLAAFLAETEENWTYSQSQCSSLSVSLAGIDSEQEKDFLLHYKGFSDRWIGLQREPGQPWRWPNGTEFDLWFPIRGGGNFAFLIVENWVSSSRCGTKRLWICSKPDAFTMGEGT